MRSSTPMEVGQYIIVHTQLCGSPRIHTRKQSKCGADRIHVEEVSKKEGSKVG